MFLSLNFTQNVRDLCKAHFVLLQSTARPHWIGSYGPKFFLELGEVHNAESVTFSSEQFLIYAYSI